MYWVERLASFKIKRESQGLRGVQTKVRFIASGVLAKKDPEVEKI